LTLSPIKILTPPKTTVEPLHLSPWCNPTRPTRPPSGPRARGSASECLKPRKILPCNAFSADWRAQISLPPSPTGGSRSTLNPSAIEFVPKTYKPKPTHNPLGGKLALVAAGFVERAYGLNGQKRVDHQVLKEEMMNLTGCSERAVQAVLYGSSYNNQLEKLRAQIPGYAVQKDMQQDFTLLPFYNFDGNALNPNPPPPSEASTLTRNEKATHDPSTLARNEKATPNPKANYSTVALLALAAILPFTLLC